MGISGFSSKALSVELSVRNLGYVRRPNPRAVNICTSGAGFLRTCGPVRDETPLLVAVV